MDRAQIEAKKQSFIKEAERLKEALQRAQGAIIACNQLLADMEDEDDGSEIQEHD